MVMVRSGNDAFVSLAHRVRGERATQAISVEELDGKFHLTVVTFDEFCVTKMDRKEPCDRAQVADIVAGLGLSPNPLCLLSFKKQGTHNTFGWVVINPATMERCGESQMYNNVL
jgi:hypothetical protein